MIIRTIIFFLFGLIYLTGCIITSRAVNNVGAFNKTMKAITIIFWPPISLLFLSISIGFWIFGFAEDHKYNKSLEEKKKENEE